LSRNGWSHRLELGLVVVAWTLIAAFDQLRDYAERLAHPGRAFDPAALVQTLESTWLWAAFTPLIFWLANRFPIERQRVAAPLAVHGALSLAFALLDVGVDRVLLPWLTPGHERPVLQRFVDESFINVYSYFAVLGVGHAIRFYRLYSERRIHATALEAELLRAQLRALEMQLRPHFLYNTLHTISGLVRTEQGPAAIKTIAALGDLLRHVLQNDGAQEVPLSRELEMLERYVAIERARFDDALDVTIDVDDDTRRAFVPTLALQPLVENAVHHGVGSSTERVRIEVRVRRDGEALTIQVRDHGPGLGDHLQPGIGLTNTRARLRHLYGDAQHLALTSADGGGTLAELRIPFQTSQVAS
jgi:signal transduction histidine kinase